MAERLTKRTEDGDIAIINKEDPEGLYLAIDLAFSEGEYLIEGLTNRLAAYEDLGSVEEIEEVKESAKFYKIAGEELCKLEIKIADGRLVEVVRCRDCKYRNTSSCIFSQHDAFGKKYKEQEGAE
jgi:hypothetical protein